VAVADIREDAARAVAAKFGVGTVYTDADALFADSRIEAVVLALPACHRTEMALKAFRSGKHVLTEKPVAMNAGEVRRMIQARGGLVAACCSSRFRATESSRAVTEFLASGALGALRVVRCRGLYGLGEAPKSPPPEWRLKRALNGGGIMMNWGCYDMDYLLGITGWTLKPLRVMARIWGLPSALGAYAAPGSEAETHVAALIGCEGGTAIVFERGEFAARSTEGAWEVIGTNGSLHLNMLPGQRKQMIHDEAVPGKGLVTRTLWEGVEDWGVLHSGPILDFAAAIRERREPRTNLERALVIQQITDAIYASSERGEAVALS
jgi:predicted dehydrogenase